MRCWHCEGMTRCVFDRRPEQRLSLSGLLELKTREGKVIEVMLRDVSSKGVGFDVRKGKDARVLKKGQEVWLSCNWNASMIPKSTFRVQNMNGFRVGVMTTN